MRFRKGSQKVGSRPGTLAIPEGSPPPKITVIEYDADHVNVAEVTDIWTFARDARSRDPNWKLVATESEN